MSPTDPGAAGLRSEERGHREAITELESRLAEAEQYLSVVTEAIRDDLVTIMPMPDWVPRPKDIRPLDLQIERHLRCVACELRGAPLLQAANLTSGIRLPQAG
ncbi:hypothetical protein LAZ40_04395 [Cereibacter sphaeroides]|uniref:hypothetical protein n=1 Tax=Cereibacter sphaeroides TaxID=1063 RepID=UPI001F2775EF|nr:hypothetical protein [Cereibacter sphaeroides]MCE6958295.1 hypothetical protein [Cereibacter sphaeroides]MCE6971905.1 hypothetical protein [Cereibacter sphaeroides]